MIDKLQFLRPDWFYAFIPLIIYILVMLRRHYSSTSWKAVCDEKLLPHILIPSSGKSGRFPALLIAIAGSLSIIAAAGPVFEKLPQPVFREQSSLVVMLDLSQSMDANDIRPSRIERAKLKLLDLLSIRKGGQTALIAYAANAYVVTPLTDDNSTITNLVPTLSTELMPAQGSRAETAIDMAIKMLQQAGVNSGHGLLITDGLNEKDYEGLERFKKQGHQLSILGVGTPDGSPVPLNGGFLLDANGAIVIPKLNLQQLQQAAINGNGLYVSLQADDSDIEVLNGLFESRKIESETRELSVGDMELTADLWKEEGPWLLLLVIPIAALWSRKGWLLCLPLLGINMIQPSAAHAFELDRVWRNNDQRAMQMLNEGDAKTAAEQFKNQRWKSSAHYRAGDYEKALEALASPTTSDDFYNKGNSLAKLGRFDEAIKAYDESLKLNANNEDASYNRELVKEHLQTQNQQQQDPSDENQQEEQQQDNQQSQNQEGDSQQQDQQQQSEDGEESEQNQQQDSESEQQQAASQEDQQQPQQGEEQSSEQQNPDDKQESEEDSSNEEIEQALQDAMEQDRAEELEERENQESVSINQSDDNEMLSEDEQAAEQWLKRIPDDPGMLLRRKFAHEHRLRRNNNSVEQPW